MSRKTRPRKSGQASKRWRAIGLPKSRALKVGDKLLVQPRDRRRKLVAMVVTWTSS